MAVQSSGGTPKKDENLGGKPKNATNVFDPQNFNLSEIDPEVIEKVKSLVESANTLLTQAERDYNEEVKRKEIDRKKKWEDAVEKWTRKETFEIPAKSTKLYRFIGYDTEQFKEIMELGRQADAIETKNTKEYFDLEELVFRKTIQYSLENIPEEVLKKLPRRDLWWLYEIMKSKNENPLPFEVNV